jgi:hypothetical protein
LDFALATTWQLAGESQPEPAALYESIRVFDELGAGSQFGIMTFPDQSRGVREMTRVVKRGGRVLMIVYGSPAEIDFLGFFVSAVHSVRSDFVPPMDPPPPEFRLADPAKLRSELRRLVPVLSHDVFNERSGTVVAMALTTQEPRAGFPPTLESKATGLTKRALIKISQIRTLSSIGSANVRRGPRKRNSLADSTG